MRVALDTNRLTDLLRGDVALSNWLDFCEEVWLPIFVLGEIRAGFHGGAHRERNEALLRVLLAQSSVSVLLPSAETSEYYAKVFVQLRRSGTPIPDNDLWIAAQVLEHNLTLVTRDRHFDCIPQLLRA